jgi:hypothetical protein
MFIFALHQPPPVCPWPEAEDCKRTVLKSWWGEPTRRGQAKYSIGKIVRTGDAKTF